MDVTKMEIPTFFASVISFGSVRGTLGILDLLDLPAINVQLECLKPREKTNYHIAWKTI
jgi:hypothetical protein